LEIADLLLGPPIADAEHDLQRVLVDLVQAIGRLRRKRTTRAYRQFVVAREAERLAAQRK
jgi:hypothetical protein